MRAAIFERPGLENLKVTADIEEPTLTDHDVLIKVKAAGVNPIDRTVIIGSIQASPLRHIPGSEIAGIIDKVGSHVQSLHIGDKVAVYNRLFDGVCNMCLKDSENTCRNGGLIGVNVNGGIVEKEKVKVTKAYYLLAECSFYSRISFM